MAAIVRLSSSSGTVTVLRRATVDGPDLQRAGV